MARYLTIDSQFNPISFDDMIAPALLYKQEYEKQQDDIDKLSEESVLAQLSNSSLDSNAYRAYMTYMNNVGTVADKLMETGKLDSNAIRKLRRSYNETIAPYETKFKQRAAKIEEQNKAYSPTKMYSRDFTNMSLDDFSDDMSYRTVDLNDIFKDAASKLLNNYQAGVIDEPEKEINDIISNYNLDYFSDEQKQAAIDAAVSGRNAAVAAMAEYERKAQLDTIKANADAARAQAAIDRANRTSSGSTKVETRKIRKTLDDGTSVIITEKDGKYYDKDGVEITDPNDINELNKQSKKAQGNYKTKFARVGTTVLIKKNVDGTYNTTDSPYYSANEGIRSKFIDAFNDANDFAVINNANELSNFIQENVSNNTIMDTLKAILGVDSDGNIETGWFVNNKRVIVKKINVDGKDYYGIKIEDKRPVVQQQPPQQTQTEEQQNTDENTNGNSESGVQQRDTTDNSNGQPYTKEDGTPIGAD